MNSILTGWQDIADFLRSSISTAKRKYKRGMPLYWDGGTPHGIPQDIEAWLRKRKKKTPAR